MSNWVIHLPFSVAVSRNERFQWLDYHLYLYRHLLRCHIRPRLHPIFWRAICTKRLWLGEIDWLQTDSTWFGHHAAIFLLQIPRFHLRGLLGTVRPTPRFGRRASNRLYLPIQREAFPRCICQWFLVQLPHHHVASGLQWLLHR